jgi:hypothetical protein
MAWKQRLRRVEAAVVLLLAIIHVFAHGSARAAESDATAGANPSSGCPDADVVWSTVIKLVPSEAAQLLAAKPRVEIVDLGERYRVRVATDGGAVERMYADSVRDCEKRTRFAAEFIVVSLLPPHLGVQPDTPSAESRVGGEQGTRDLSSKATPSQAPTVTVPAAALERDAAGNARRIRTLFLRIELSATLEASPSLGSPGLLMWGGDLRVRMGTDRLAGIVGIAYLARSDFNEGDFTGSVTRVPAMAGVRARVVKRSWRIDGDLALSAAVERYEGVSPHAPSTATRVTPGIEVGVIASPRPRFGLAPMASLRCAWFPLTQELAAAPQGNLGNTPSFWVGVDLGMSLEL